MAEQMSFKEKLAYWRETGALQVMTRTGQGPAIREYRDEKDGHRIKATRDELGNITKEHNTRDDRVDVNIKAPHVKLQYTKKEIRDE